MVAVIHRRQRAILDFITQFIQKNGYAPTLREIADSVGLSSLATVHEHVHKLMDKGILKQETGSGGIKGIKLVHKKYASWKGAVDLPVLGYIAAGKPIETYSEPGVTLQVAPNNLSGTKRAYVLQVKGDSMVEDGILDGDYVVIEEDPEIKNGDIVVALLENGLATLKKFFKEETRVKLAPANSQMAPIYATHVRIQGKVKSLIRKFF
jgi:repressor LexA